LLDLRLRQDRMARRRTLPLPSSISMPQLWMLRLQRVATSLAKNDLYRREAQEAAFQQLSLGRFAARSEAKAEWTEFCRRRGKDFDVSRSVEEQAVDSIADQAKCDFNARFDTDLDQYTSRTELELVTWTVVTEESQRMVGVLRDRLAKFTVQGAVCERRTVDFVAYLSLLEERQFLAEEKAAQERKTAMETKVNSAVQTMEKKRREESSLLRERVQALEAEVKAANDAAVASMKAILQTGHEACEAIGQEQATELEDKRQAMDARVAAALSESGDIIERISADVEALGADWRLSSSTMQKENLEMRPEEKEIRVNGLQAVIKLMEEKAAAMEDAFSLVESMNNALVQNMSEKYRSAVFKVQLKQQEDDSRVANTEAQLQATLEQECGQLAAQAERECDELVSDLQEQMTNELEAAEGTLQEVVKTLEVTVSSSLRTLGQMWDAEKITQKNVQEENEQMLASKIENAEKCVRELAEEKQVEEADVDMVMELHRSRGQGMTARMEAMLTLMAESLSGRRTAVMDSAKQRFLEVTERAEPKQESVRQLIASNNESVNQHTKDKTESIRVLYQELIDGHGKDHQRAHEAEQERHQQAQGESLEESQKKFDGLLLKASSEFEVTRKYYQDSKNKLVAEMKKARHGLSELGKSDVDGHMPML